MPARNLVVVVADTWRDQRPFDRPGAPSMPFLDAFSRDAMTFDRLLASSSWTAPSHVSLLSGAPPWETHFHVPGAGPRSPRAESLADKWGKAGGVSAAFSANFLVAPSLGTATGYTRYNPGFRAGMAGYLQLVATFGGYERRLYEAFAPRMAPDAGALARVRDSATRWGGTGLYKSINAMRSGDMLLRAFRKFLRQRSMNADRRNVPLHLFFNLAEPHEPYLVGQNGGASGSRATTGHLPTINFARFNDALVGGHTSPAPFFDAYRESLTAVDTHFHTLVDLLKRDGILDNATLVFLSDHGQNLGEHGFYGHGFYLYDELVKIPAYLWEFQDGKPVGNTAPPDEWVDHRHMNDLLCAFTADGAAVDLHDTLRASLDRKGPASSFYEGPGPRAPDGMLVKAPRSAPYRLLRVQRGNEVALVRSDVKGGNIEPAPLDSPDKLSRELFDIGRRLLQYEAVHAATPVPGAEGMDAQVDARLKSWGYD
ncbi:MAG: sulfatase-like hydrolase/transferase [Thermoplasmata archaeon]|nr:sulfatase-like hydrolase/transferase [Thermoplasmata archaeon]